ncbi:MAG: hypothetical protein IT532_01520 [Burkholderiales bacterium]|nr:hypothetical protein [Burkholderiales bacterium]
MKNGVVAAALLCLATPAFAAWTAVGEDPRGTTYADAATIEKAVSTVKMWSIFDYGTFQRMVEVGYFSQKSHNEYDCAGKRMRGLHTSLHAERMGAGAVIYEDDSMHEWESVPPGSVQETLLMVACR